MIFLIALSFQAKAATAFTDSLHFIVHNQKIVNNGSGNVLQFDISVYRPNTNWNDNYFNLGDADFYFTFNPEAFDVSAAPVLLSTNEEIDNGSAGGSHKLYAGANVWWASSSKRLRVNVIARSASIVPTLSIPLRDTLFIARIQWKVAAGNRDPKIEWDMTASGAITLNNNPIIPTFVGGIDKYPDPGIFIDNESDAQVWACEGSDVLLFVNARSTGDQIEYLWQVSNGGDWIDLDPTLGAHTCAALNFNYLIHGSGDTLVIRQAPGNADLLEFQCKISDPTLSADETRLTEKKVLQLRDSIRVFLSAASTEVNEGGAEIKMCPTSDGSKVRLNVWGPDYDERNEVLDVFVEYYFVGKDGSMQKFADTIRTLSATNNHPDVGMLYYKELTIQSEGTYYVSKASTSHCYDLPAGTPQYELGGVKLDTLKNNAMAYAKYDTLKAVYSTSPDTMVLEKYSIAMDVDTNLMTGLSGDFSEVYNLYDSRKTPWLGEVQFRPAPYNDTVYHSKAAGLDTVYYVKKIGDCPEVSMREVEVIDNYYLSIKVMLEGAMFTSTTMTSNDFQLFPQENGDCISPYDDKLSFSLGHFEVDANNNAYKLESGHMCDWIYIKLRDGLVGPYVDSTSALLREDGIICNLEGKPYISFKNLDKKSYYVYIKHRNHLEIISSVDVTLTTSIPKNEELFDMTNPENVYGNSDAMNMTQGVYCMVAGDVDGDSYITVGGDLGELIKNAGNIQYVYDVTHDGFIAVQDQGFVNDNIGKVSLVP